MVMHTFVHRIFVYLKLCNKIAFIMSLSHSTASIPSVTITAHNPQIVGQSLALECNVTVAQSVTSRVDIIWNNDGSELERMEDVTVSSTTDNSVVYTDTYAIPQLSTTDDGREYQCEVVINTNPPVIANDSVILDIMG